MRRLALAASAVCLLAAAAPTAAAPTPPEPGPGYVKTPNVTHVATIPLDTDGAGGRLLGKDFFLRTAKGITVYDVSDPSLPVPKGFVAVPQTPNQEREDPDTNGDILVTGQAYTGLLHVVDIRNRTAPTILSTLRGGGDHTNTCVLDCTFVYGSEGTIVDLRDPATPEVVGKWFDAVGVRGSHDLTEVKPGLLLVASNPVAYIDARNPLAPRLLARGPLPDDRYTHGMAWPRGGKDRFVLGGSESGYGCTRPEEGTFFVHDTRRTSKHEEDGVRQWTRTGDYTIAAGLPTEGKAPASELCGHWFDPHPAFKDGGFVAMAWYGWGVRFLEVTRTGAVQERGFWQPVPGQSSAVYWVSPDTVWVTDYSARGIDVLRFDTQAPAQSDPSHPGVFRAAQPDDELRARLAGRGPEHAVAHHTADGSISELASRWVCKP